MLELNNLYYMDCMDGMKQFPDKYFDLVVVDPPYGIGENSNHERTKGRKYQDFYDRDKTPFSKEYFNEMIRVSKNQIIWGANHFISAIPYDSSCWLVWDKDKGMLKCFSDCELAWTSFKSPARMFKFRWNGFMQEDMRHKEERIHLTQKPIPLYRWILGNYSNVNDKILDPCAGSCSSLIACYQMNRQYIGFELSEHYYESGKKRLDEFIARDKAQMKLF
jgi:site-specific DNA-methyltransferase (adenine-specific)